MSLCQCYANLRQKVIRCQDYKKPAVSSPWMTTKKTCGTKLTDDLRFPLRCTICRYIERIHSCCAPTGHLFPDGRCLVYNIPPKCWAPNSQTNNMSITSFHLSGKLLRVCPKYLSGLPLSSPAFVWNRKLVHFQRDISTFSYDDEGDEVFLANYRTPLIETNTDTMRVWIVAYWPKPIRSSLRDGLTKSFLTPDALRRPVLLSAPENTTVCKCQTSLLHDTEESFTCQYILIEPQLTV
jgi:hypothetical protein